MSMDPIVKGRFAVYRTADGFHVSVRVDGEDTDRHIPVPGMVLRLIPGGKKTIDRLFKEHLEAG